MIIKCKMCGGDLNVQKGNPICECEFCGTQQTIPQTDNEKKVNLFNRANRLRINAEFDKAASIYESIIAEFPEEAEAYWGLCLCKYGIEYVDDPRTGNKIPTCHRTISASIMDDNDFNQACENADAVAKRMYREEAKVIDRLQQEILSIVANESPYDVFICYKETDDNGSRTEDSVVAQDIYDNLTEKGLKVFFSRITLEDKLGQQYEPYIYAALHSSRVMIAVGTRFEYYDAVWVKNEWARFIDMMRNDKEKTLIPCYKNLDAYDLPKEFKNLQAQDMNKLGWLQDLTRGVLKLCGKDRQQIHEQPSAAFLETLIKQINAGNKAPAKESIDDIIRRAYKLLENEKWEEADECADRIIEEEPTNATAYLIKLMCEHKYKKIDEFKQIGSHIDNNDYFKKILRFGNDQQRQQLCQLAARTYFPMFRTVEEYQASKNVILEKFSSDDIAPVLDEIEQQISEIIEDEKGAALVELSHAKTIDECQMIQTKLQSIKGLEHPQDALALVDKKIAEIKALESNRESINVLISKLKMEFHTKEELAISSEREAQRVQNELDSARKDCARQAESIYKYDLELKNLRGLFTGKRRKELEEIISRESDKLKQAEDRMSSLESAWKTARSKVVIKPDSQELVYMIAKEYYNAGMYTNAYAEYQKIPQYRDVASIIRNDTQIRAAIFEPFHKAGSIVSFGRYTINNERSKDPIEWLVLDAQGSKSLLVTRYSIDMKLYHHDEAGNWINCDIRAWLNKEFFNLAFTSAEQSMIQLSSLEYITGRKATCQDRVFLLSEPEVEKYFPTPALRKCPVTPYVYSQFGKYEIPIYQKYGNSASWWERSNDCIEENSDGYADYVYDDGSFANDVMDCIMGIRPAMWVRID